MTIDQITNELKRRIIFMERHPSTSKESVEKLAIYKTWVLMAEFIKKQDASENPWIWMSARSLLMKVEKEFSK